MTESYRCGGNRAISETLSQTISKREERNLKDNFANFDPRTTREGIFQYQGVFSHGKCFTVAKGRLKLVVAVLLARIPVFLRNSIAQQAGKQELQKKKKKKKNQASEKNVLQSTLPREGRATHQQQQSTARPQSAPQSQPTKPDSSPPSTYSQTLLSKSLRGWCCCQPSLFLSFFFFFAFFSFCRCKCAVV